MGNRAVITTAQGFLCQENNIGVYLHWFGGELEVKSFLTYCKLKNYRNPDDDPEYGFARLCQVIGNYIGGGLSIGINIVSRLDKDFDNGTYILKGWDVACRKYNKVPLTDISLFDMKDMLLKIDAAQPIKEQLGIEKIKEVINNA